MKQIKKKVYVLTIKRGCCSVCAETYTLGVFTRLGLVNHYIIDHTIYGKVAQFTSIGDIELDDDDHGLVVLSVTKVPFLGD